jgi:hypothetical protein
MHTARILALESSLLKIITLLLLLIVMSSELNSLCVYERYIDQRLLIRTILEEVAVVSFLIRHGME